MARGGSVLQERWWQFGTGMGYQAGDGLRFKTHDGVAVMWWDTRYR